MQYILKLTYLDDKEVSIVLDEKQVPKFLESYKKDEPYWQENAESAFLVAKDLIRYVNILKYVAPPVEVKPAEPKVEKMPEAPKEEVKKD